MLSHPVLAAFLIAVVAPTAPPTCPVDRSRYVLRAEPSITARFHSVRRTEEWSTGLAFEVSIGKTGRRYWFLPWQGGTDRKINLAWVRERHSPVEGQSVRGDHEFFSTDSAYVFNYGVPKAGGTPPAHLFIPDLERMLWYSTPYDQRDTAPKSFFDLVGCGGSTSDFKPDIEFPPSS